MHLNDDLGSRVPLWECGRSQATMVVSSLSEFSQHAERINSHGEEYRAEGFRSAVIYRNTDWCHLLDFTYDMAIPSVGQTETAKMRILHRFAILCHWPCGRRADFDHGTRDELISFIVHPDYTIDLKAQRVYTDLLTSWNCVRNEKPSSHTRRYRCVVASER
jgi:hypothetical protein